MIHKILKTALIQKAGIDAETLKKIVEQAKNTQNSDTAQIVQDVPSQEKTDVKLADTLKTAQTVKDVAENINTQVSSEAAEVKAEVKNNTALEKEAQTLPLKTAKDNLAADTSRLTANIEQAETAQNAAPAPDLLLIQKQRSLLLLKLNRRLHHR